MPVKNVPQAEERTVYTASIECTPYVGHNFTEGFISILMTLRPLLNAYQLLKKGHVCDVGSGQCLAVGHTATDKL